ncbi:MAG: dodecin domain-containing protein [Gemmatimonadaceae bacterium]|nr:dodecin domain-containing protein [Caulobacter sp.]
MSILKVVEVLAESSDGWEDAAKQAVDDAARTLRHIRSIYIENLQATVKNGRIDKYRVNAKITFAVEDES